MSVWEVPSVSGAEGWIPDPWMHGESAARASYQLRASGPGEPHRWSKGPGASGRKWLWRNLFLAQPVLCTQSSVRTRSVLSKYWCMPRETSAWPGHHRT